MSDTAKVEKERAIAAMKGAFETKAKYKVRAYINAKHDNNLLMLAGGHTNASRGAH